MIFISICGHTTVTFSVYQNITAYHPNMYPATLNHYLHLKLEVQTPTMGDFKGCPWRRTTARPLSAQAKTCIRKLVQ